jgi:hypothetical protein
LFVLIAFMALASSAFAVAQQPMKELSDESMEAVTGAGIAFTLEDFRFAARPNSYIEVVGSNPLAAQTWQRGNYRWYGLAITDANSNGIDWFEVNGTSNASGGCVDTTNIMACSMGSGVITKFASIGNPYLLRVFAVPGYDYQGANVSPTVLEFVGPTQMDNFRWAFWGEVEVVNKTPTVPTGSSQGTLKSQTLIVGSPTSTDHMGVRKGAVLRLFPTANTVDPTLGIQYESRLSGSFRFSTAQTTNAANTIGLVPDFDDNEGLYFKNVQAFLPLGQMNYQALTANKGRDGSGAFVTDGNFQLEVTALPCWGGGALPACTSGSQNNLMRDVLYGQFNKASVYDASLGYDTARLALQEVLNGNNANNIADNYYRTHGYVRWGTPSNVATSNDGTVATDTTKTFNSSDGIYFTMAGAAVNYTTVAHRPRLNLTDWDNGSGGGANGDSSDPHTMTMVYYGGSTATGTAGNPGTPPNPPAASLVTVGNAGQRTVNIGDARVEGMIIQRLSLTSCGAGTSPTGGAACF